MAVGTVIFWSLRNRIGARRPSQYRRIADGIDLEHVGSTAVPGLPAKPIIDLDVVVACEPDVHLAIARLREMGYAYEGDLGVSGRHAFVWPPNEARHHLYLLSENAEELHRHIAFRDALRRDRDLRDHYGVLKRELAKRWREDRAAYAQGKAQFIESVIRQNLNSIAV
jgi:GrpB-like predicted nucleotidyltransferase (UPF0157 family)